MQQRQATLFSIRKAHETQLQMSRRIVFEDRLPADIRLVAGVDVAYAGDFSIGAATVLKHGTLDLLESKTALCRTRTPYIPTLLSFREILPITSSINKLTLQPDLFLVDGHGFAHPYRCGLASHLGLVIGKPTIGVAKNKLFGEVKERSDWDVEYLKHNGEIIGAVVTTKTGSRPVYVSVGHMVSLRTAIKIVKEYAHDNRIPHPLLKAHEAATAKKRKIHIKSGINR